jgi:hypothetical protein
MIINNLYNSKIKLFLKNGQALNSIAKRNKHDSKFGVSPNRINENEMSLWRRGNSEGGGGSPLNATTPPTAKQETK